MSNQIAFTLPSAEKKKQFQAQLAAEGLTTKAFFTYCVEAYLGKQIRFGLLSCDSEYDRNEETEENLKAYEASLRGDQESFSLSQAQRLLQ
ncbi:MAG: hypothetical protein Q4B28_06365 [bacterium]|nr:hypothetical protein [bacterium]